MYPEKGHIQGKEWIQLPHSRIQCQIYKHDNEFTASVKDENFFTSWVTFNFSLAPQNFINYQISFSLTVAIKIAVNDIFGKNIYQFV